LWFRARASAFVPSDGGSATIVIGEVERAHCLLTDSRIFALGVDWKFNRDVVPFVPTAGESRFAHEHALVSCSGDQQLALGTRQPEHVLSVRESDRLEMFRCALAGGWTRVEQERRGAVWRLIPSSRLFQIDGLQVPIWWREWAPEDTYFGAAAMRGRKHIGTRVRQGDCAPWVPVSKGMAPVPVVKTVMPRVGRLRTE
jgi:hypothetical protein